MYNEKTSFIPFMFMTALFISRFFGVIKSNLQLTSYQQQLNVVDLFSVILFRLKSDVDVWLFQKRP